MRAGDTPLIDSARNGRATDVAALLADGADVNEPKTNGSGATPLYIACQEGHAEVVTTLIAPADGVQVAVRDVRPRSRVPRTLKVELLPLQ